MFIKLENISKTFFIPPKELKVFENINLQIKDSQMLVIFGKSGAGKSTLLSLIGGMDTPTSGKVIIDGVDLLTLDKNEIARFRKEKIGYIFQAFNLFGNLKAIDNIILPIMLDKEKKEKIDRVMAWAEEVGIKNRLNHLPGQLSLGEQQRVAILRALINNPKIILADEPTAHLDNENSSQIIQLFKGLNQEQGTTIVLVTDHQAIADNFEHKFSLVPGTHREIDILK